MMVKLKNSLFSLSSVQLKIPIPPFEQISQYQLTYSLLIKTKTMRVSFPFSSVPILDLELIIQCTSSSSSENSTPSFPNSPFLPLREPVPFHLNLFTLLYLSPTTPLSPSPPSSPSRFNSFRFPLDLAPVSRTTPLVLPHFVRR